MKTKVEIAIDYLLEHGQASTADLNRVMQLPDGDSAASYLFGAVDRGALVRNGRMWSLPADQDDGPTAGDIIIGRALRTKCGVAA